MEDWDELLQGSPAYNVYDEFNSTLPMDGYENDFQSVINMKNSDSRIKNLCGRVVGILSTNSKLKSNNSNNREYCMHLHFWLYDQIIKIFKPDSIGNAEIVDILKDMFDGWYNYNSHLSKITCSAKYSFVATFEEWNRGKILNDYFKNFQYITNNYSPSDAKCEKYRSYLEYINEQYREYKKKCSYGDMTPCNYYYTDIEKYNPNVLLSKPSCEIRSAQMVNSTGSSGEMNETLGTSVFPGTLELENVQDDSASSNSVRNVLVAVSSSLLGIFIFFFVFYRLTPLGYWLRTRLLSKRINDHNIYEEENEYLENTYEQEKKVYDRSGHNIGYNTLNKT
ncbi:PIR Superfamily Protein [Plasmodium ovale wallikeri]|uniref:PIR Superfamily Protein n=2 Tax=Plasmodium ovale TaxID=36330 RepID=A0A1A9AH79_PLAOA|nr:PIR Superfamily Protein [Plasmodium ovale wallikeri]SBT55515.1 PIR Superfamily Protein [Plasmodium ovale wallikeri]SBT74341.1 PIR protein [Plasmodium ovale]